MGQLPRSKEHVRRVLRFDDDEEIYSFRPSVIQRRLRRMMSEQVVYQQMIDDYGTDFIVGHPSSARMSHNEEPSPRSNPVDQGAPEQSSEEQNSTVQVNAPNTANLMGSSNKPPSNQVGQESQAKSRDDQKSTEPRNPEPQVDTDSD